ncbi:nucleotidyltransferase domain-containing protein [Candidatus Borrarchaeum sp.]|uniref:nucleotidyltransferase domain-containing protein n=1 Tax=Candidatus Borrarchaeum sp. TaxID=2846742 RepID=UPI00257CF820|nr:nucleotidyltransferase domain-containing protein [Candidatus Borrarchaeum sp.]
MSLTLKELRAQKEKRKEKLFQGLKEITQQLKEMGVIRIILFGSVAHGKVGRWSDLDLFVIMPPTKSGKEWMKEIYEIIERAVDCDILAYTEEELNEHIPISRFLRHVLKTGKIIYEIRPFP